MIALSAKVFLKYHFPPFGMIMPGRFYSSGSAYRYGFNGKENDNSTGERNLDFGTRIYDSRIGRWLSVDPEGKNMPWLSPYQFASNSPIYKLDPDGKWDIEIHSFAHRGKMSYGILILRNNNGEEIARYVVRVAGSAGVGKGNSGPKSRKIANGDTPQGKYDIADEGPWWKNSKDEQAAFGTSSRLAMTGVEGEIMGSSLERQNTIRIHAGRQELNNKKDFDPKNKLKFTNGCVRMYQKDLDEMKAMTLNLQKEDKNEKPGFTIIKDDLIEWDGRYYISSDFENLIKATENVVLTENFAKKFGFILPEISESLKNAAKEKLKEAESKGIKPEDHQNTTTNTQTETQQNGQSVCPKPN